jgi:OmpA-OmpF porin, OOP family
MMRNRQSIGLKGQLILAQGKRSVALGLIVNRKIVRVATFFEGLSLFRTKGHEPQFRPKEVSRLDYCFTRTVFHLSLLPQALPGAIINWPFRPNLCIKSRRGTGGLYLFVIFLLISISLRAQDSKHYLHFDVGGGIHDLNYGVSSGTVKAGYGYSASVGYSYFFGAHWGLQAGVAIQSFEAQSTINGLLTMSAVDSKGDAYQFRNQYTNWQEKQQALFVDLPLTVQYRHFFNKNIGLLVSVGGKVSIPVSGSYKTTGGEMRTTGYYSQWNAELYDLPLHGFTNYSSAFSGDLSLKTAFSGIADVGCLVKLTDKMSLYLGGYLDYGLNSIISARTNPVYQPDGTYNGMLASDLVKNVKPIAFGLKVGICRQMGKGR